MSKSGLLVASAISICLAASSPARADDMAILELVSELGDLVGSEELCGYTIDEAALVKFIEERVPADDMSFGGTFSTYVDYRRGLNADMAGPEKIAFCTSMRRAGKHYGLTK